MINPQNKIIDGILGTGAVSSPWWLMIQDGIGVLVGVAGFILLLVRIAVGIKELRRKEEEEE